MAPAGTPSPVRKRSAVSPRRRARPPPAKPIQRFPQRVLGERRRRAAAQPFDRGHGLEAARSGVPARELGLRRGAGAEVLVAEGGRPRAGRASPRRAGRSRPGRRGIGQNSFGARRRAAGSPPGKAPDPAAPPSQSPPAASGIQHLMAPAAQVAGAFEHLRRHVAQPLAVDLKSSGCCRLPPQT